MAENKKVYTDLNTVSLTGTLVRDSELATVGKDFNILNFSIANNYAQKKGESYEQEVNYFDCKILGKRASVMLSFLKKGTKLAVTGKLRQERWEKDGKKNSRVTLTVDELTFMGGKRDGSSAGSETPNSAPTEKSSDSFPEDIPF